MSKRGRAVVLIGIVVALAVASGVVLSYRRPGSPSVRVAQTVAAGWHDLGPVEYPSLGPGVAVSGTSAVLVGGKDPANPRQSIGTTTALRVDLTDGSTAELPDLPQPLKYLVVGSAAGQVVVVGNYCNVITAYDHRGAIEACTPNIFRAFVLDLSKASDGWTELRLPHLPVGPLNFNGTSEGQILFSISGAGKAILVNPLAETVAVVAPPHSPTLAVLCLDGPDLIATVTTDSAFDNPNPGDGKARSRSVWVKPAAEPNAPWQSVAKNTDEATTPGTPLGVMCSGGGPLIVAGESDGSSSRFDRATGTLVPILDPPQSHQDVSSDGWTRIDGGGALLASTDGQPGETLYRYSSSEDRWSESAMPKLPAGLTITGFESDHDTVVILAANLEPYAGTYRVIVNRERG
jgi:hypothetical protein